MSLHWVKLETPALILAPMEGVTDAPMRSVLSENLPITHCVSEFIRIPHHIPSIDYFQKHAPELTHGSFTKSGCPFVLQILGGDTQLMTHSALRAVEAGAKAIDINFGCPAPTVNRHDGGATLLKYPQRIYDIVFSIRQALSKDIPLSVKMRLGWDDIHQIYQNAEMAIKAGCQWLTIHGRTRMQGYTPPAYWEPIGKIKKMFPQTPIIANGEIWTMEDFKRCQDETHCIHFMMGRGLLADPLLVFEVAKELELKVEKIKDSQKIEFIKTLFRKFRKECEDKTPNEKFVLNRTKQWLKMMSRKHPQIYDRIKIIANVDDAYKALEEELNALSF